MAVLVKTCSVMLCDVKGHAIAQEVSDQLPAAVA
jgi:hypothetical protein